MSEPTIDEMLEWLDMAIGDDLPGAATAYYGNCEPAIRAILEQHRPMERGKGLLLMHPNDIDRGKLEAIRAFVERVEKRHRALTDDKVTSYRLAVHNELAAMEKANG